MKWSARFPACPASGSAETVVWSRQPGSVLGSGRSRPAAWSTLWPGHRARSWIFRSGPDGRSIAAACSDRVVRISDALTGEELRTLGHLGRVKCVDFHPVDGGLVSGGEQPGDVKLWDAAKGLESSNFAIQGEGNPPEAIAFDATGGRLLGVVPGGDVRVVDLAGGRESVLHADLTRRWQSPAMKATFSADGRILATVVGREADAIQMWTVPDGTNSGVFSPLRTLGAPSNAVYQLAMSRDGGRLASSEVSPKGAGRYRRIVVWETASGRELHRFPDQPTANQPLYCGLALGPDGALLAFDDYPRQASGTGSSALQGSRPLIHLFDLAAGRDRAILRGHDTTIIATVFSRDGRVLATADWGHKIILWDVASGTPLHRRPLEGETYQLAFSPDGTRLAAVNRQEVKLWDVRTGREALRLRGARFRSGDSGFNPQLAWSPDGRRLAASNFDCSLSVWDGGIAEPGGEEAAVARGPLTPNHFGKPRSSSAKSAGGSLRRRRASTVPDNFLFLL